jgi:TonB family protein
MRTSARYLWVIALVGAACLLPPPLPPVPLWRFASFFELVKKQVSEHWDAGEAYRKVDPTGTLLGLRVNRYTPSYTEVGVELTADGGLRRVAVVEPSGLRFLDDEAVAALRAAAPFPRPPRPLIDDDGVVRFRLGFFLDPLVGGAEVSWKEAADGGFGAAADDDNADGGAD